MNMSKSDHALAVIKAGLSSIPYVGGAISSLVGDYIPVSTQHSLEKTVNSLKEKLKSLETRIDVDSINKDEFAELFKSCYLITVKTHQQEKLNAVTNIISNILLKNGDVEKLSYEEIDHFVRCVDNLSIGALKIFTEVINIAKYLDHNRFGVSNVFFEFQKLQNKVPSYSPDLTMSLLEELTKPPSTKVEGFGVRINPS